MIIGNGLIATNFQKIDQPDVLIFASGVSNSLETNPASFQREKDLLTHTLENNTDKKLIYFSTLSIEDKSKRSSPYVIHKKYIENYIKNNTSDYLILRIGNIVGHGGNPNTLFNFLIQHIHEESPIQIHTKAKRWLIDMDDIVGFVKAHITGTNQHLVNLAYPHNYSTHEIIKAIEKVMGKKALYTEINEGDSYPIDFNEDVYDFFAHSTADTYLTKLAEKYAKY